MNVDTQRLIDLWIGVPLCALLSLIGRFRRRRRAASPPRNILVMLLSEMGSMVCTQPMFREFAQRYPGANVHVLVLDRNRAVVDLLGIVPPDHIVTIPDETLAGFVAGAFAAIRRLRSIGLDVVIDCELFARVSAVLAFLCGARLIVGFHRHTQEGLYRGSFIDRRVLYNPYAHIATQFLTLARAVESTTTPIGKEQPLAARPRLLPLDFPAAERAAAAARLWRDFPGLANRRLVLLYPGSGPLPTRAWPLEHFSALAAALVADGCAVAVIGLAVDKPLGTAIARSVDQPACVDLTSYTATLRDLMLIFHASALLVSNDGGPNHFAALTPVPIVSLFGPETPVLYAPLAEHAVALYRHLPCSPCVSAYNHRSSPCDGDNQCLKQISVATALEASRRLMSAAAVS